MVLYEVSQAWFLVKDPDQIAAAEICSQSLSPLPNPQKLFLYEFGSLEEKVEQIMILPLMHGGHDMDN